MIFNIISLAIIKCVIFDVDGTLLDSEGFLEKSVYEYTKKEMSDELKQRLQGKGTLALGQEITKYFNISEDPLEFMEKIDEINIRLLNDVQFLPGAKRIVEKFHKRNMKMGLATGSPKFLFDAKIKQNKKVFDKFDAVITGDQVEHGKPHPESFLRAMKSLNVTDPSECLVFEDSANGVKAAVSSGMHCVMVPNKALPYEEELKRLDAKPTIILDSLNDFNFSHYVFMGKQEINNANINNNEL